jgi:acyl-CoA reductase-like NAD-dependent aldehyde dehydrogenase
MLVGSTEPPKAFDRGFWVSPTLFTNVEHSRTIAQEIFGPVLAVILYRMKKTRFGSSTRARMGWQAT